MGEYELSEPRRHWISKDNYIDMSVYVGIKGCMPLADLVAYIDQQGADHAEATVNFSTVRWTTTATLDEVESRRENERRHDERHAKWERETYARLRAKFEGGQS